MKFKQARANKKKIKKIFILIPDFLDFNQETLNQQKQSPLINFKLSSKDF
jgi:hypothetical protein